MIELAVGPERCVVARLTGCGKASSHVVGALRIAELVHVATGAILRRALEPVTRMALHATRVDMASCERIARGRVVVEAGTFPQRCCVTHRAVLWEAGGNVIGTIRGLAEIQLVTSEAGQRRATKAIVDMALLACGGNVFARKWKAGLGVIEDAALPLQRGVAILTGSGKPGSRVVGCLRIMEFVQVACGAFLAETRIALVQVALLAHDRRVLAGERKPRPRVVIELRTLPLHGGVAERAVAREARFDVVRIGSLLHIIAVAGEAVLFQAGEPVVNVALLASDRGVLAGEGELRRCPMIELRAIPL